MYQVKAWNWMGGARDPSPQLELREAILLMIELRERGFRRITLTDLETGEELTDLENFVPDAPGARRT